EGEPAGFRSAGRSQTVRYIGNPFNNRKLLAALLTTALLSLAGFWSAHAFLYQSLPGEAGFEMKEQIEDFRLILSLSPLDEAELLSDFAARRSSELTQLAGEGKSLHPGLAAYARTLEKWITVLSTVAPLRAVSQPDPELLLRPADTIRLQEQVSLLEACLDEFNEHLEDQPSPSEYVRILETGSFFLHQYKDYAAAAMLFDSSYTPENNGILFASLTPSMTDSVVWTSGTSRTTDSDPSSTGTIQIGETATIKPGVIETTGTPITSKTTTPSPTRGTNQPTATHTLHPSSTPTATVTVTAQVPAYAYGDINLDHAVTTQDALLLSAYLKGTTSLSQQQLILADCVQDYTIDRFDQQAVQLRAVGLIGFLPLQPEELPSGDVNGDGQVTPGDALLVEQHLTGVLTLSPGQQYQADVCWNGHLNGADRDAIFNYYLRILPSLPVLPESAPAE
ncbi:MAG: dockerin type I repeat-containing protein, partial [Anaerolineales bacterium]|nr:dockerin type I repeat-containing protein [Anaerolineales bacterium]